MGRFPYIDLILEGRRRGEPVAEVFDRYVHWGYWDDPRSATGEAADLVAAMERLDAEVLAPAGLAAGQTVLDAGCGFGGTLAAIGERHRPMTLAGVNVDPRQLHVLRQRVRPRPGNRLAAVAADACDLPFPEAAFDRVLAVECVFLFRSRRRFLAEAARVLKPGGRLVVSDFVPRFLATARFGRRFEERVAAGYGAMPASWNEGSYRTMAAAAGLEIAVDRDVTRQTLPTYPALSRLFRQAPDLGKMLVWPTRILGWLSRSGLMRYRIVAFDRL